MSVKWTCIGDSLFAARMPDGRELRASKVAWAVSRIGEGTAEALGCADSTDEARRIAERAWAEMQPSPPADPRTDCERRHDALLAERREKGRATYGQGLDHRDARHDWKHEAMCEALDMSQYLMAEVMRLEDEKRRLEAEVDAARALAIHLAETLALCEPHFRNSALSVEDDVDEALAKASAAGAIDLRQHLAPKETT